MKESIVLPPTAAETHLKNHRYWITVSRETQSKGLQRELKVEKWNNLRSPVYRLEEREVSTVSKMGGGFLGARALWAEARADPEHARSGN